MNWYLENGNDSDIVLSSRIRLARNIKEFRFKRKMTQDDIKKLLEKIKFITPSLGFNLKFLELNNMDDITKLSLVEKHIISPEMIENLENGAILINDEENICIMINEEDHVRIQTFASGLDLKNILKLAVEIDEILDKNLVFSFNNKYGYLTACPTNVGTGLRASVMVHLPALKLTGNLEKIFKIINSFGMTIRGTYGEESKTKGDIYQISNNQTLGMSEEEIVANIENITKKIIEQERLARKYLAKNTDELEDKVYRSFGILTNARKITSDECDILLSDIKLGTDLGIINEIDDSKVKQLIIFCKSANLQKKIGKILKESERNKERAEIIKQIISSK